MTHYFAILLYLTSLTFPSHFTTHLGTGTGTSTSTTTTTSTAVTKTPTSTCTAIAVTFDETVTTTYGETIKLSGNIAALGDWDTDDALVLSATDYTSTDNLWFLTVDLTPGEVVEYKFINVASDGDVTWETDPNHTYTVSTACGTAVTVSDSWQG